LRENFKKTVGGFWGKIFDFGEAGGENPWGKFEEKFCARKIARKFEKMSGNFGIKICTGKFWAKKIEDFFKKLKGNLWRNFSCKKLEKNSAQEKFGRKFQKNCGKSLGEKF